jgi:MinD-like ATPase involved in chromosome partitioning or flagellar assembly
VEQIDAWSEAAQDRLVRALRDLEGEADVVVIDAGRGTSPAGHRFCDTADETLIVSTADDEALVDAYTTIKSTHENGHGHCVRVLFNRVQSEAEADSARERLAQTCRRFLGTTLECAGCCLEDRRVAQSSAAGVPLVVQSPRSALVRDLERLATTLSVKRSQPAVPAPYGALVNDRAALATA